jgi:hypothetical protein
VIGATVLLLLLAGCSGAKVTPYTPGEWQTLHSLGYETVSSWSTEGYVFPQLAKREVRLQAGRYVSSIRKRYHSDGQVWYGTLLVFYPHMFDHHEVLPPSEHRTLESAAQAIERQVQQEEKLYLEHRYCRCRHLSRTFTAGSYKEFSDSLTRARLERQIPELKYRLDSLRRQYDKL